MYITGPAVIKEVTGEVITSADLGGARQQELNGNISYVATMRRMRSTMCTIFSPACP